MTNLVSDHFVRDWKLSIAAFLFGGAVTSVIGNVGVFLVPFAVGMVITYERMHHHPWPMEARIVAILFVSLGCMFGVHFWHPELFQPGSEEYWWWLYGVMGKSLLSGVLGMYAMKYWTFYRKHRGAH